MSKHLAETRPGMPAWWTLAVLAILMTAGVVVTGVVMFP